MGFAQSADIDKHRSEDYLGTPRYNYLRIVGLFGFVYSKHSAGGVLSSSKLNTPISIVHQNAMCPITLQRNYEFLLSGIGIDYLFLAHNHPIN